MPNNVDEIEKKSKEEEAHIMTPDRSLVRHSKQEKVNTERPIQPGYLPLREAAAWAGVSERTLKRWISRGLPTFQAGPREKVLIRPIDIDTFLTRRQVPTPDLNALVEEVMRSLQSDAVLSS